MEFLSKSTEFILHIDLVKVAGGTTGNTVCEEKMSSSPDEKGKSVAEGLMLERIGQFFCLSKVDVVVLDQGCSGAGLLEEQYMHSKINTCISSKYTTNTFTNTYVNSVRIKIL